MPDQDPDDPNVDWMSPERREIYDQLRRDKTPVPLAIEASGIMAGETNGDVAEVEES